MDRPSVSLDRAEAPALQTTLTFTGGTMHAFAHLPALTARLLGTVFAAVIAMSGLAPVAIGDPFVKPPPAPVPCKAAGGAIDGMARFICRFYPPGNGKNGGAPVIGKTTRPTGDISLEKLVGYLRQGENYVLCQRTGVSARHQRYFNNNWAYTRAVNGQFGWVNAVYARGGDSDGPFGGGVPRCPDRVGSAPKEPPAPLAPSGRAGSPHRVGSAKVRYVALGDSYSSGVGSETYYSGPCERSPLSYAPLLAAQFDLASFDFRACGGKKASEMSDQLDGLRPDTTLVTITAGGNDVEFSNVMSACGDRRERDRNCSPALTNAERVIRAELPGRLLGLYQKIRRRAPAARLVVLGYPGLIEPTGSCGFATFSGDERTKIQQLADRLAEVTAAATRPVSNTVFVDSRAAFKGHLACGPAEWINGFSPRSAIFSPAGTPNDSFHPNKRGYVEFTRLIRRAL